MAIKYYDSLNVTGTTDSYFLGDVGIGTSTPGEKLEVNGNIKVIKSGETLDVSVFHSDGNYAKLRGQGLFLSRATSYLAPEQDNFGSLAVGYNGARWGNVEINAATVKFENGSNEFMRITSTGNVGIGATSPSEKLHVKGNILVEDNDSTDTVAQIGNSGDDGWINLYANGTSKAFIGSNAVSYLNGGNVGIGTTSPGAKLQIGSATYAPNANLGNNLLQIKSPSGYAYLTIGNGDSANATSYIGGASGFTVIGSVTDAGALSEHVRITNTGNVGIGTTSPTEDLSVSGDANITGKFAVGISATHPSIDFYNEGTAYFNGATTVDDTLDLVNLKVSGAQGTDGQVLTSTGSGVAWEDAGGVTSIVAGTGLTGGTITTSGTIALDYSGNNNFILSSGTQLTSAADDDVLAIVDVGGSREVKYIEKEDFLEDQVTSVITGEPNGSDSVINIVSLTQAEYDAGTPVATTLYIIT